MRRLVLIEIFPHIVVVTSNVVSLRETNNPEIIQKYAAIIGDILHFGQRHIFDTFEVGKACWFF